LNSKVILGGILALLLFVLSLSPVFAQFPALQTTTFINVGQGDSALIRDGLGFDVLIDGGEVQAGLTVLTYLRAQGVNELDVMLASLADSDHIGGLIEILRAPDITVQQVLYNGYPGDTATWTSFVAAVAAEGLTLTTVQFPADLTWGTLQAHILNPASGLTNPESNDASLVIRLDYNEINYLFTGDINSTIEATVVARQTPVASEILKVAHHGSSSSSSNTFLAAANPTLSAISVGDNIYGHPSPLTIERLVTSGSQVIRTDQYGNITIFSDGLSFDLLPMGEDDFSIFLPIIQNN
jgi:beta-lactamase superfamily II metal-dependent hydrolase